MPEQAHGAEGDEEAQGEIDAEFEHEIPVYGIEETLGKGNIV